MVRYATSMRAFARLGLVTMVAVASACSVGQGEGSVRGSLHISGCDADLSAYDMNPDFFGAQSAQQQLLIRIQKGGAGQEYVDNLVISVDDVFAVRRSLLNTPIAVEVERPPGSPLARPAPPVKISLSLRGSCGTQYFNPGDPAQVVLHATSGTITFTSMLDPNADLRDTNAKRIEGSFSVHLDDPRYPGKSTGDITGSFKFFYQRGGPAQPFP